MRREFLKKIFNIKLISRFFAKQIDLVLIHLIAFVLYSLALRYDATLNPFVVFLPVLFLWTILEALLIFYFNTTLGKFFLGLRVYPSSLKNSFKRSFLAYTKGLGIGLPILGWILGAYHYIRGINNEISWDKYGPIEQKRQHFIFGIISLTIINFLIIISIAVVVLKNKEQVKTPTDSAVETVIIEYPSIDSEEVSEELLELWDSSCLLGALGFLDYFGRKNINYEEMQLIKFACERGYEYIELSEDPDVTYMKACGFGIGVGSSLYNQKLQDINFQKQEEILKTICLPFLENQ